MNIIVKELPRTLTEKELLQLFLPFGEVRAHNLVKEAGTGKSKGFGFVEMPQQEQAQAAITALNGKEFKGRALNVNEARPKTDRPRRPKW